MKPQIRKAVLFKSKLASRLFLAKYALLLGVLVSIPFMVFAANTQKPTPFALADIPPTALDAYYQAGDTCEGVDWAVLAGIGKVESDHGRVFGGTVAPNGDVTPPIFGPALNGSGVGGNITPMPAGRWSGMYGLAGSWMRAVGPMQFLPPTFAAYGSDANGDGAADPHNMFDATKAAAALLCSTHDGPVTDVSRAIKAYNRSDSYVAEVLYWAGLYRQSTSYGSVDSRALLVNPNIVLAAGARADLEQGIVDPRLATLLADLSTRYQLHILNFRTGHPRCKVLPNRANTGPNCSVSNHYLGRATDIIAVNLPGQPRRGVNQANIPARTLTQSLAVMNRDNPLRPDEVGSPWASFTSFAGHFTNSLHQDHLHIGYRTGPPPSATHEATRAGIDIDPDLPGLFDGITTPRPPTPAGPDPYQPPEFAAPDGSTVIAVTATPDANDPESPVGLQQAIDTAKPGDVLMLEAGDYPPIILNGATGLTIVGAVGGGALVFTDTTIPAVIITNSSEVSLVGLTITDAATGITVADSTGITVRGNTISRVGGHGIRINNSVDTLIEYNTVTRTGLAIARDGYGILANQSPGTIIRFNQISGTTAAGIRADGAIVEHNVVHTTATTTAAIHVDTGRVAGNIVAGTRPAGADPIAGISTQAALVVGNIVWDNEPTAIQTDTPESVVRNVIVDGETNAEVTQNLDGVIFSRPRFAGGWVNADYTPTPATQELIGYLLGDGPLPPPGPNPPAGPTRPSVPLADPQGYTENLALIRQSSIRNTNHDTSPWINTPSDQLNPLDHYGPRSDYLNLPGGNPEQSFPTTSGGQFRAGCEFSHFAYDDPLVFPNQPGASHLHMFFGNTNANAFSTYDTILNSGSSTCNGQELNRTAYWAPAMIDGAGNVRIPERIVVYYKGEGLANGRAEPYPEGSAIIPTRIINTQPNGAGGASGGKYGFYCTDQYSGRNRISSNTIPACDGSEFFDRYGARDNPHVVLEMNVKFPQCLKTGSDPSDWTNWSTPTSGSWYFSKCDAGTTHTNLEYFINYKVDVGENTRDWYLASDIDPATGEMKGPAGATLHADWWGGWHRQTMQTWINNCVNYRTGTKSGCGFGYLSDGGPDNNNPYPGPALKQRPQYTGPTKVPLSTVFRELCATPETAPNPLYCNPPGGTVAMNMGQ